MRKHSSGCICTVCILTPKRPRVVTKWRVTPLKTAVFQVEICFDTRRPLDKQFEEAQFRLMEVSGILSVRLLSNGVREGL